MKNGKYSVGEFSGAAGISIKTLQRWDREGTFKARRTTTNRRYYLDEDIDAVLNRSTSDASSAHRENVIYARVSSTGQKDDLKNQVEFLRTFCNARGVIVQKCIEDIGSGLNYNRPKWNRLLDDVMDKKIGTVYITHKDRFIRFGYSWFERLCRRFGTEIVVVVNETMSPTEEMVQDIIAIIHVFSCRIYGMRKYKDKIMKDIDLVSDPEKLEQVEISED